MIARKAAAACVLWAALGAGATAANGIVVVDLAGNTQDAPANLAVGPDGRIYAIGTAVAYPSIGATVPSLVESYLLAFDGTGVALQSFGTGGRAAVLANNLHTPLIVRADESIAYSWFGATNYDATGTLESQFPVDMYGTIALQSDGKYVLFGYMRSIANPTAWTVTRLKTDGSADGSFGGGSVTVDAGGFPSYASVIPLPDGKILVGGAVSQGGTSTQPAVLRFNGDGTRDFGFGVNGQALLPVCNCAVGSAGMLAFDSTANTIYVSGPHGEVTRLTYAGAVDSSYSGIGATANVSVARMTLDGNGRIVLFGTQSSSPSSSAGYVARYLSNASLDTTFGGGGQASVQVPSQLSYVTDGAIQSDGKLVLALTTTGPSDAAPNLTSGPTDVAIARLNGDGSADTQFGMNQPDADVYPDVYTIAADMAPYGTTYVVSAPVTITGINAPTSVALVSGGGDFSVNCTATFTATRALISNGNTLCVRHAAATQAGGTSSTVIDVGGRRGTYTTTSSATPADTVPDAFAFQARTGVDLNATVTSNTVTITGLTGSAPIAVDNGAYSIGCDPQGFTNKNGTITNGSNVCVEQTTSGQPNTTVKTTLAIGGVTADFTSTTGSTTPDAFSFAAATSVATATLVVSSAITVTGISATTPISVTGGEYSVPCTGGTFTSQPSTIKGGQTVCVRHTSSSQASTMTTTTLAIGSVSGTFTSTTAAASSGGGSSGGGGSTTLLDAVALAGLLLMRLASVRSRRKSFRPC